MQLTLQGDLDDPRVPHVVGLFTGDLETTLTAMAVEGSGPHPSWQQFVTLRTFYSTVQRLCLYTLLSISFQLVQLSRPRVD